MADLSRFRGGLTVLLSGCSLLDSLSARRLLLVLLPALLAPVSAALPQAGPWSAKIISAGVDDAASVYAADVDGDGDIDTLAGSSGSFKFAWYENIAGDGSLWAEHTISTAVAGARSVYAADVDGDGDIDALSASESDDKIAWYENTAGDGSAWTERTISTAADAASWVVAADVDGDGDTDALSASFLDDKIAWYENLTGDGSAWTAHTISTAADFAAAVVAADMDGDGDIDALSSSELDDRIAWYENTVGDGSVWTEHTISTAADNAHAVYVADVDGDGQIDALSASLDDDKVAWYENISALGLEVIRLGTPPNPRAFLPGLTSGPVIGSTWDPVIDHTTFQPGAILDFAAIGLAPTSIPSGFGTVLCGVSPTLVVAGSAGAPFALPIPNDCTHVGVSLCTQGGSIDGALVILLTNALDITIGTY